jgi:hypothetical protein
MPSGDEAALLLANATRGRVHHVPGRPYANWFLRSGYFDEVMLFMDCDRERYPQAPLRMVPWADVPDVSAVGKSRVFYGFATKSSRLNRERRMPDGKVRGIFTQTLLAGLNGGASDKDGFITSKSLANYLYDNMQRFLTPEELRDEDVPKAPELIYDISPGAEMFIAKVPRTLVRLEYRIDEALLGERVRLLNVQFKTADEFEATEPTRRRELASGLYLLEIAGKQHPIALYQDSVLELGREGKEVRLQLRPSGGDQ